MILVLFFVVCIYAALVKGPKDHAAVALKKYKRSMRK